MRWYVCTCISASHRIRSIASAAYILYATCAKWLYYRAHTMLRSAAIRLHFCWYCFVFMLCGASSTSHDVARARFITLSYLFVPSPCLLLIFKAASGSSGTQLCHTWLLRAPLRSGVLTGGMPDRLLGYQPRVYFCWCRCH